MVEKSSKSSWNSKKVGIPEIDEDNQIFSVCTQQTNKSRQSPEKRICLPYGVGPVIDCEIDDDCEEPDYLSYSIVPEENLVEDSSIPGDGMPWKQFLILLIMLIPLNFGS